MARLLIERRRRLRLGARPRAETFAYLERARLPFWEAVSVFVALWLRRRAFRVIRMTQRIEARAYARAEWEDS